MIEASKTLTLTLDEAALTYNPEDPDDLIRLRVNNVRNGDLYASKKTMLAIMDLLNTWNSGAYE